MFVLKNVNVFYIIVGEIFSIKKKKLQIIYGFHLLISKNIFSSTANKIRSFEVLI